MSFLEENMQDLPRLSLTNYTLTSKDVARILKRNLQSVCQMACTGKIPALKVGRRWYFSEQEVMEHFRKLTSDLISRKQRPGNAKDSDPTSDLLL